MNNIRKIRKELDKTQKQLAAECGWSRSCITNYETEKRVPRLKECHVIVGAFNALGANCTFEDVFPPQGKAA